MVRKRNYHDFVGCFAHNYVIGKAFQNKTLRAALCSGTGYRRKRHDFVFQ